MIKILKHGQKEFEMTCSHCGCTFTYEYEDIHTEAVRGITANTTATCYVICPDCGHRCPTNSDSNIGWPWPNTSPIPCNTPIDTSLNPCVTCNWWKKMATDEAGYVGDIPCTWCPKNPFKVTCGSMGTNLTTPTQQVYGNTKAASSDAHLITE